MRRYLEIPADSPKEQTASAMRQAKWTLCQSLFGAGQAPTPGVLDVWPQEALEPLIALGWQRVPPAPSFLLLRKHAKRAVLAALTADVDCLAPCEHALLERMLIGGGRAILTCAEEFDAALALRNRLWCDLGGVDGLPAVQLDPSLEEPMREALMRPEHAEIRNRIFSFNAMIRAMLYAAGFLDDQLPRERFIVDVLGQDPRDTGARHLARNFMEAAYDCVIISNCRLLVHEGLAFPETFVEKLAMRGSPRAPEMDPNRMLGCMNGLLPEERPAVEGLQRVLRGALRPDVCLSDVVEDLKLMVKQGADFEALRRVTAGWLCVLPTAVMEAALRDLLNRTPKWLCDGVDASPAAVPLCHWGVLQ